MTAQDAALRKAANGKLRRPLTYSKSSNCADAKIGDAALLKEAVDRRSAPRQRGPARLSDIDDAGATVSAPRQTSEVTGYCGGEEMGPQDVGEAERDPESGPSHTRDGAPLVHLGET